MVGEIVDNVCLKRILYTDVCGSTNPPKERLGFARVMGINVQIPWIISTSIEIKAGIALECTILMSEEVHLIRIPRPVKRIIPMVHPVWSLVQSEGYYMVGYLRK